MFIGDISIVSIVLMGFINQLIIELDDGKIYRKALYVMVKTMVSCRFSLKPIHWTNIDINLDMELRPLDLGNSFTHGAPDYIGMVLRITPVAGGLKAAQYAAMREMTPSWNEVVLEGGFSNSMI